jgi:hypothetical protein
MPLPNRLLHEFMASLAGKAETTVDTYHRELRHFLTWLAQRPGNSGPFSAPRQLTKTALETYLASLQGQGHSLSHCARVKSVVGSFAGWLIEEKALLRRNPITRGASSSTTAVGATRVQSRPALCPAQPRRTSAQRPWGSALCLGILGWMSSQRCGVAAHRARPRRTESGMGPCGV